MGKNILDGYLDQGTNNSVYYEKYLEETKNNETNTLVYPFLMDGVKTATYNTNSIWKNDFELVKGIDPNLLVEARKNSQNNPYEMDCMSRLYQSKMKVQCRTYKTAWETDNEKLSELANTFSSSQTSIEMQGDTANNIWELFSDYCAIIQCMRMGIFFDLEDNNALYNKLGDVDLDGSVILHGIESARTNYSIECTARDNSISAVISTSDEDFSRWLWSEARRHGDLAHSYYDEWMHYEDLKREYEEINEFYLTGVEYRTLAQEGMDILATAYDGSGNYVVPAGFAGWRTQFEEKNKAKILEYASKWKDENGEWDTEKLGKELCLEDASELTELDYLALCYAVDDLDDEQMADVIELSYNESSQTCKLDGTVTVLVSYQIGDSFKALSQYYGNYLDNGHKEDINYRNYNILYTYAELNSSFCIETTFASYDHNKDSVNINVEIKPDEKTSGDEFYYHNYTTSINTTLSAVGPDYDKNFTITPNNANIDNTVANYAFQSVASMVDGVGSLTADQAADKVASGIDTALCLSNPGVATAYSIVDTVNDYATAIENYTKIEDEKDKMNVALLLDDLDCSATVIMDETTNTIYFTHVEYDEQALNEKINKYNATVQPYLQIPWDAKTM